jgi:hypothetical protein
MKANGPWYWVACPALAVASWSHWASAIDCDVLFQEHLKTDLTLDFLAFDQSPQGFRALAEADCHQQAADLIEKYMQAHGDLLPLRWHLAQSRAQAGDYKSAIESARLAMQPDGSIPGRWNDYVSATIAFFERDKNELVFRRNRVAESEREADRANAKVLDRLIRNFDASYKAALHAEDAK